MTMQSIMQDVRYAMRQFRKSPGFAITVVAVLALGIGANIAVFTILNGVLLRPLPFAHPDQIVTIKVQDYPMSYANMLQLRDAVGPQLQFGAEFGESNASVAGPGGRVQTQHVEVTAGLPAMLGVQPFMGRTFRHDENDPGRNHVVLLGEDTW